MLDNLLINRNRTSIRHYYLQTIDKGRLHYFVTRHQNFRVSLNGKLR